MAILTEENTGDINGYRVGVHHLVDPRIDRCKKHALGDIVTMALGGVLSGAMGWVGVAQWAEGRAEWLGTFLDMPNGVPSHDTFDRVFSMLDPDELASCLSTWDETLRDELTPPSGVIAIDGKRLRRCFGQAGKKSALHLLTAWASDARVVLAQQRVGDGNNEITEIPALLRKIDVSGCIVTIDAIGAQQKIVAQLTEKKADYVIGLKGNQKGLLNDAKAHIDNACARGFKTRSGETLMHDTHRHVDSGHGRIETRTVTAVSVGPYFHQTHPGWPSITSFIRVHRTRDSGVVTSEETTYFISSLKANHADMLGAAVRAHWSIENDLHWTLDTQMNEDQCRLYKGHGPENFALLRRHALSKLKNERSVKAGTRNKQLRAAASTDYLLKLLAI